MCDCAQDYFSSSDARQAQTAQIQRDMDRTKDVMRDTIGESCNSLQLLGQCPRSTTNVSASADELCLISNAPLIGICTHKCDCAIPTSVCTDQALARGDNLDRLVEKTDDLRCVPAD